MKIAKSTSAILDRLNSQIEDFLPRWTINMGKAGYLESTTAKRQDCILSFQWFFEPLMEVAAIGDLHGFGELIANKSNWADKIIQTSRRHRSRGVTCEMFVGCFKTLVHSVLEMIEEGNETADQKNAASEYVRLWADALEVIIIRDWATLSQQEADDSLNSANRQLTMEKCKYENVIDSISDLVLVIDNQGMVMEVNRSARQYFSDIPEKKHILTLLDMENKSLERMCAYYSKSTPLELSLGDNLYFHCMFVPLNQVSLASDGYLVILKDVSAHVKQSEILESIVTKRTSELMKKKNQLQELNITLSTVMKSVDKEREKFQKSVGDTVRNTLLPALVPIRKEKSEPIRNTYLDIVEDQLLKLTWGGKNNQHALLLKLTPMEMKVCRFIQAGTSTKEIAEAFNLSVVTIQTHRRNIRRKLDLKNRNVNLSTFLNQAGQTETEVE